jgi:5-methylcytosine-specific restriction endonuclease McrA
MYTPSRICHTPGCTARVPKGYCPACTRRRERERNARPERQEAQAFYKSKAWAYVRERVLLRDAYQCQGCARVLPGNLLEVHHKQPRAARPDLELDPDNLTTLCKPCHSRREPRFQTTQGGEKT